jgi:hypothetical protein
MKKMVEAAVIVVVMVVVVGAKCVAAGSWLERAGDASLQIVAVCQSRTSHWEEGTIYSDSLVSVSQVLRGTPDLTMVVRQRGGEVDGIGQKVSHTTLLAPGKSYLLFLTPSGDGRWLPTSKGVNPIGVLADGIEGIAGEPLERVIAELGGGS